MSLITDKTVGQRLDIWLAQELKLSRSQCQKIIKSGQALVNGQAVSSHYQLKINDEVKVNLTEGKTPKEPPACLAKLAVIKETNDYLVLNKPAGLVIHGTDDSTLYTLVDWLLANYPEVSRVGDSLVRPGIVHRLDKEVSGLLVVARTQASFDNLKEQFKLRQVKKEYQALVYGRIDKDEDSIDFLISRSPSGKMAARPVCHLPATLSLARRAGRLRLRALAGRPSNQDGPPTGALAPVRRAGPPTGALAPVRRAGRSALTYFQVLKRFVNYTLLRVTIKTGRTHQIRVHLAAYNHPVVGDNLYSTKVSREKNRQFNLGRVFLTATSLSFTDLAGQTQKFAIDLPAELQAVLEKVK